jgi:cleavage and polyadenylation specificity factor subunit 2
VQKSADEVDDAGGMRMMRQRMPLVPCLFVSSLSISLCHRANLLCLSRRLEFFSNPQALLATYSSRDPKLILAVPASLSHGPSRSLFSSFAAVPDNVVLLTSRGDEGTLARQLFDRWDAAQRGEDRWDNGRIGRNIMLDGPLTLEMHAKVPLRGTELEKFLEKERLAKESQEKKKISAKAVHQQDQRMLEADEGDSDTDSDEDDEEDEVERTLGGDMLDLSNDMQEPTTSRAARTKAERADADWDVDDEGMSKTMLSYDIYLKGNVSKATSFFKSADGHRERFRMFPYVEKRRRVDEYGEIVDVGMWLRKGKALEEAQREDRTAEIQAEEVPQVQEEPPSKFIVDRVDVQLACRLLFVDLEGLNDGRAVKTIVPQINPRKMVRRDDIRSDERLMLPRRSLYKQRPRPPTSSSTAVPTYVQ